jgi:chaperone modulatory protein CbpM
MADSSTFMQSTVVEEEFEFTLVQLSRACRVQREQVVALVDEGVLQPRGEAPEEWRFAGPSLRRARTALRLARDLELSAASAALVLDLLDQIDTLQARLRRAGG